LTRAPRPLAEVLPALRSRLAPLTVLADVQTRWAEVAGHEVARQSQPVSERSGVVTVRCTSAVWASELSLMSPRLLRSLNETRPDGSSPIEALRFTVR
jgi:predicted nucleic acid-binding Zn ribbon protein